VRKSAGTMRNSADNVRKSAGTMRNSADNVRKSAVVKMMWVLQSRIPNLAQTMSNSAVK